MNPLKTPHQFMLEEAGAMPKTNGLLKTPKQMLFEESGILPRFDNGGEVSPADMRAEMMIRSAQPEMEMEEIEEPEFEQEELPELQNMSVFMQIREILNNPGELSANDFDPTVVRELTKLFGPNIFAQSETE